MIGEKLSALLESKKIKAGTLASQIGIPKSTIYSIIKRNNKSVDFSVMERIADALDVPVEYFYDRTSHQDSNKLISKDKGPSTITIDGPSPLDRRLIDLLSKASDETKEAMIVLLEQSQKR